MWAYTNIGALYHHGIPGMKWGIRRFQNKDGTRTAAGKKRQSVSSMSDEELQAKNKRMALEESYKKLSKQNAKPSKMEKTKKVVDASSALVNEAKKLNREASAPKKTRLDLSKMSDQQLRDRINRANLERQYNDLFALSVPVSRGRQHVSDILEGAGGALAIGSSALAIAVAIKELKK